MQKSIPFTNAASSFIARFISFADFVRKNARVKAIWAEQDLYNVFPLDYIINEFLLLEENLKTDIENYFDIKLQKFIKHIPMITEVN